MQKHSIHNPHLSFEAVDPDAINETLQNASITVRDLLKRLAVGDMDSSGFIKPVYGMPDMGAEQRIATEEEFDTCSELDTFGLYHAEIAEVHASAVETVKREKAKTVPDNANVVKEGATEPQGEVVEN